MSQPALDDRQSGFKQLLEVCVVLHHKLALYVVLPVDPDRVGQLAVHFALVDGVVEDVKDNGMAAVSSVIKDAGQVKSDLS